MKIRNCPVNPPIPEKNSHRVSLYLWLFLSTTSSIYRRGGLNAYAYRKSVSSYARIVGSSVHLLDISSRKIS
jgi:hypothetical protein